MKHIIHTALIAFAFAGCKPDGIEQDVGGSEAWADIAVTNEDRDGILDVAIEIGDTSHLLHVAAGTTVKTEFCYQKEDGLPQTCKVSWKPLSKEPPHNAVVELPHLNGESIAGYELILDGGPEWHVSPLPRP